MLDHTRPRLSVIIPVYNGEGGIVQTLERLREQSLAAEQFEVIVVNDGSRDGTENVIRERHPWVRLVTVVNGGSYQARNVGIRLARGDVLAFTDADCCPAPDWLAAGIEALRTSGADLIAGAVITPVRHANSALEAFDSHFGIAQQFYAEHLGFGATANLFVASRVFNKVPGFDPRLRSGGDKKFCEEAIKSGFRIGYAARAKIEHEVRRTLKENIKKTVRIASGLAQIAPPWSHFYVIRLRHCHPEYFNYQTFLQTGGAGFRLRFRLAYYGLRLIFLGAYARAMLAQSCVTPPDPQEAP